LYEEQIMRVHRVSQVDKDIGKRIRLYRIEKGLSQTALGTAVGVTFQQIQKYEKGTNRVGGSRMQKIATALGTTPAAFFGTEQSGEQSEMLSLLTLSGVPRLLRCYSAMRPAARDAIIRMAVVLARDLDPQ
jgi:transcriptional regulator with XRE-family HTH domain